MKLKDILKTDTDNKGWLRVFKKLGADAEMLKYVNENISKSGGSGGQGAKEYYYKVQDDVNLNTFILQFCNIKRAICAFRLETGEELVYKETAIWHYLDVNNISSPRAFVINDEEPIVVTQPDSNARIQASYLAKGNLINRIIQYVTIIGGQNLTEEQAQDIIEPFIQEITKEEYESLITQ